MNIITAIEELYNQWDGKEETAPIVLRHIHLLINNNDIESIPLLNKMKGDIIVQKRVSVISDVKQPLT